MDLRVRIGLVIAIAALAGTGRVSAQEKTAAPAAVTPAAIAKGDSIFHKAGLCYACHGSNAQGAVGPNLTDAEWLHSDGSYDAIVATVMSGVPAEKAKKGVPMPSKGGSSISDEDVKAVAAYVYSLSHK
jgi:cbb3-type cytochrome c oxidase subunit III